MTRKIWPGTRVFTLNGELDRDENDMERVTPPDTWGHVHAHNHADHWDVVFPNGAQVVITVAELRDPSQYVMDDPRTIQQLALYIQQGFKEGYSIFDDEMTPWVQDLTDQTHAILWCQRVRNDLAEALEKLMVAERSEGDSSWAWVQAESALAIHRLALS